MCADLVVVDCGFSLEEDEELMFDTLAPRRNAATLVALEAADEVVVVGGPDPVALQRLVVGLAELREVLPSASTRVVVNRAPQASRSEIADVLRRHARVDWVGFLPPDPAVGDALVRGLSLVEVTKRSPLRSGLAQTAAAVLGSSSAAAFSTSSSGRPATARFGFIWKVPMRPIRRKADPTQVARRVDSA